MNSILIEGGITQVGHDGDGFAFDNESPRHDLLLHPFRIARRLVRNARWLAFMADGRLPHTVAVDVRGLGSGPGERLAGAAILAPAC